MLITQPEYGERKAYLVVEIAGGFMDQKALRENGCDHFLCAGFANAAGDANDWYLESVEIIGCQLTQSISRGGYEQARACHSLRHTLAQYGGCTVPKYLSDKVMSIDAFSGQCHK